MKTIAFFHRLELTDLFAPVAQALEGRAKIVHLAYDDHEVATLRRLGVTGPVVCFKSEIRALWETTPQPDAVLLEEIDTTIRLQTDEAFNLNGAIQSDRGFSLLGYEECLRLTAVYYRFWTGFLDEHGIDHVVHEPTSLIFNFLAAVLCRARGGSYLYDIMVAGDVDRFCHLTMSGFDFTCPELNAALARIDAGEDSIDQARCDAFLGAFRTNFSVFLSDTVTRSTAFPRLIAASIRNRLRRLRARRLDRRLDNIDWWNLRQDTSGEALRNLVAYRLLIDFDEPKDDDVYYFYPIHTEPEAVVLYHGHGLYTNQVKLIENIAGQLPPGVLLYVKDHPHVVGYRSVDDYRRLKAVPNIRLIRTAVSSKRLIQRSLGVVTITGTAGFEALLLGKQVYTFGKTFYSACSRVVAIHHVRDLRAALYRARDLTYADGDDLYRFVTAYLRSAKPGTTDYFAGRARKYGIDLDENARRVAQGLLTVVESI